MHKGWLFLLIPCLLLVLLIDRPTILQPPLRTLDGQQAGTPEFDSWSTDINTIRFTPEGEVEYTLEASRQVTYVDNSTLLDNPVMRLHQDSGEYWNIVADSGRIHTVSGTREAATQSSIDRIELIENVELQQLDVFGHSMVLTTDFLTIDPNRETLATDRPVRLISPTFSQTAVGMLADLTQNTITFFSQLRGRYEVNAE